MRPKGLLLLFLLFMGKRGLLH